MRLFLYRYSPALERIVRYGLVLRFRDTANARFSTLLIAGRQGYVGTMSRASTADGSASRFNPAFFGLVGSGSGSDIAGPPMEQGCCSPCCGWAPGRGTRRRREAGAGEAGTLSATDLHAKRIRAPVGFATKNNCTHFHTLDA